MLLLPLALRLEAEVPLVTPYFYADDITLTGNDSEELNKGLRLCEEYLGMLKIELNPSKTQYLAVGGAPDHITVGGIPIEKMKTIKIVGTYLHSVGDATAQEKSDIDLEKVLSAYARLRTLPLQLLYKDNVIDQIIGAKWRFGCWHCIPGRASLKTWRAAQVAAVRPAMAKGCRSATVYHSLALKGHKVDPLYARLWELLRLLQGQEGWFESLVWCMGSAHPPIGPISSLAYILKLMKFEPRGMWLVGNEYYELSVRKPMTPSQFGRWAHCWRLAIRRSLLAYSNEHRSDFKGCADADTDAAKHALLVLKENDRFLMEQILAGGLATGERKARWAQVAPQLCNLCGQEDTAEHRWWICPHWAHLRVNVIPYDPQWPACFRFCGIPTFEMHFDNGHLPAVHFLMLNIQKSLNAMERVAVQEEVTVPPPKRACASANPRGSERSCFPVAVSGGASASSSTSPDAGISEARRGSEGRGDGGGVGVAGAVAACALDTHSRAANKRSSPKERLRELRARPRRNGSDAADLPKPIDLPHNIVLTLRSVAGFGDRYVVQCSKCGSVGQVANRTRFIRLHRECNRKKVRVKLSEAERAHFEQHCGKLSSWKRERAKKMLVAVP